MIMNILKDLWKWVKWILVILLIGLLILALRIFVLDKDYNGSKRAKDREERVYGSSSTTDTTSGNGNASGNGSLGQKVVNGAKAIGNATVSGYKGDSEYDYNSANFDEWFLMYEGEQYDGAIQNVLDHLIENSKGNFYARTSVTAVGFGGNNTVDYEGDVTTYQNAIQAMKDSVTSGMYDVSFKYAGIMTYVNEIVITKK
ncbi:MAG: hypothetical protein IJ629_02030 [Clostridia bacterium]|nr:hypothetical protein [Clostridia bacterium]